MNKAKEEKLNTELDQLHSQRSIDMDSRFKYKLHANELIYILQVSGEAMEQEANKILTEKIKPTVRRIEEIEQELGISPTQRISKLLISCMGP